MKPLLLIYALLLFFPPSQSGYTILSPVDFYARISSDSLGIILDVRLYEDFRESRIKDAVWVGEKEVLVNQLKAVDKEQKIYLYCYVGRERGKVVVDILLEMGYLNIFFLKGGFDIWVKQGMEVDDSVFAPKKI